MHVGHAVGSVVFCHGVVNFVAIPLKMLSHCFMLDITNAMCMDAQRFGCGYGAVGRSDDGLLTRPGVPRGGGRHEGTDPGLELDDRPA